MRSVLTVLTLSFSMSLSATAFAQFGPDGFDYPLGPLDGNGGWDAAIDDGLVTDAQGNPGQSFELSQPFTAADQLFSEVFVADQWSVTADLYVPFTLPGPGQVWFILLNTYVPGGAKNWSTQIHFTPDGLGNVDVESVGGSAGCPQGCGTTVIPADTWVTIQVDVDLDPPREYP